MINKIDIKKELYYFLITIIASLFSAFCLHIFVYGNKFAPSGVDGIATMLQEMTKINAGLFSLLFNLPLLVIAWFYLNKRYVVYTVIFTVLSSVFIMILGKINFYQYVVESDRIIVSIFSGFALGIRTGLMLRIGSSSGGIDIIACIIQQKTNRNIEKIISFVCYIIIGISYFVYKDLTSILLSIIQMFVFEKSVAFILKDSRNAVKFEIITKNPNELKEDIIVNLKHGATIINSKGMYTQEDSFMIVTIINNRQVPELIKIIKKYEHCFAYYSDVSGVKGNFRWNKSDVVK